mmetsp:Transcript_80561/g.261063  ORF Transcript_80561/g.261063 Transcript_80561/m.261063 type:complete len:207 (-) Transcript_80561:511-1131(-)
MAYVVPLNELLHTITACRVPATLQCHPHDHLVLADRAGTDGRAGSGTGVPYSKATLASRPGCAVPVRVQPLVATRVGRGTLSRGLWCGARRLHGHHGDLGKLLAQLIEAGLRCAPPASSARWVLLHGAWAYHRQAPAHAAMMHAAANATQGHDDAEHHNNGHLRTKSSTLGAHQSHGMAAHADIHAWVFGVEPTAREPAHEKGRLI